MKQKLHYPRDAPCEKTKTWAQICASWTNYLMNHRCLKLKWKDLRVLTKAKLGSQSTNKRQIVVIPFQNVFFTKWYCNHQVDDNAIGPYTCLTYTGSLYHHHWNLWIGTQVEFLGMLILMCALVKYEFGILVLSVLHLQYICACLWQCNWLKPEREIKSKAKRYMWTFLDSDWVHHHVHLLPHVHKTRKGDQKQGKEIYVNISGFGLSASPCSSSSPCAAMCREHRAYLLLLITPIPSHVSAWKQKILLEIYLIINTFCCLRSLWRE